MTNSTKEMFILYLQKADREFILNNTSPIVIHDFLCSIGRQKNYSAFYKELRPIFSNYQKQLK